MTGNGTIALGWQSAGYPAASAWNYQDPSFINSDGQGGVLLSWIDFRAINVTLGTGSDIFVQRIRPDGTLPPGWPIGGAPATCAPAYQGMSAVAPDGSGGAFVLWEDLRNAGSTGTDVYAQHLDASGVPSPGWPADGLPLCTAPNSQLGYQYFAIPDRAGGAIFVWDDLRRGNTVDIYAQHLLADGTIAPGWVENGLPLLLNRGRMRAASDGMGGFYIVCWEIPESANTHFYLQRFTSQGVRYPGWPANGVLLCGADKGRDGPRIAADGSGGVLATWYDSRASLGTGPAIFAMRVLGNGAFAPGWTVDGVRVSTPQTPFNNFDPTVAPDGYGGAYIAWEVDRGDYPSFIQHLDGFGQVAAGWPLAGYRITPTRTTQRPEVVEDGAHGAIVVWSESDSENHRLGLYAQRFMMDGPVATTLALASAEATSDHVVLTWQGTGVVAARGTVERRTAESGWAVVGSAVRVGLDRLQFEDRNVVAGARYAYRLAWSEGGVEERTAESWVEIPLAATLALDGFRPNPAIGAPLVVFSLAGPGPGRLELFDLAGRRVAERDLGSLAAGRHSLRLAAADLAPGAYVIRLTHGGRSILGRGAILR